ncbi:venom metalloproteinase antarease TserMP_A-like [Dermacentor albipictus]|uniref:venom metalloproteinase antarease TserMP_A-like n=1 Tax=Dermacentor albipictus TaxID=60249 RepID=UPI0038FC1511
MNAKMCCRRFLGSRRIYIPLKSVLLWHYFIAISLEDVATEKSVTVYPEVHQAREDGSVKLVIIQDDYTLNLKKASVAADRLLIREITENGITERYVDGTHNDRFLYQDEDKEATLLVKSKKSGGYDLYGLVNFTHEIEPTGNDEVMTLESTAHTIKQVKATDNAKMTTEPPEYENEIAKIEPRESASSFLIETYLILDDVLFQRVTRQGNDIQEYATFLMAVVNQILGQLEPPGRILLKAIEINKIGPVDYVAVKDNNIVDAPGTLGNLEKYSKTKKEMQNADAVIILIGRDMEHRRPDGSTFVSYGLAYTRGACNGHGAIVAADLGTKYTGALSVAHEVGHFLGSPHDGAETTKECPADGGTIMSKQAVGVIRPRYSECSKRAIKAYVTKRAKCLFEQSDPTEKETVTEVVTTTEVPATGTDPVQEKRKRRKCQAFLTNDQYLLKAEQMVHDYPTCKILCTVGSETSDELTVYAVVGPDRTPCDKPDSSKVCKRGLCIPKKILY